MKTNQNCLYGVNLGGWLVLEKWMTPSVFAGVDAKDEYTLMQTEGSLEKLRAHQREFIREADFAWLHANGVEAVRIPIGYWALDGDPPYRSCVGRLDWAFKMATRYELKVLLCLHGAPGSQNGQDHSGRIGKAGWYDDAINQQATIATLEKLALRYKDQSSLWGIELLNEPRMKLFQPTLRRFYTQTRDAIESILPTSVRIVFSDAFMPRLLSGALRTRYQPVLMDIHWYQFASIIRWLPMVLQLKLLTYRAYLIRQLSFQQPIIIGEWSGVISRQSHGKRSEPERKELSRRYIEKQLAVYAPAAAWFYWSYKTENPGAWNFRDQVEKGVLILPK